MSQSDARLAVLKLELKQCELYALWWMSSANNQHTTTRIVYKGGSGGEKMTPEELRDDAMETSLKHIRRRQEIVDEIARLMYDDTATFREHNQGKT